MEGPPPGLRGGNHRRVPGRLVLLTSHFLLLQCPFAVIDVELTRLPDVPTIWNVLDPLMLIVTVRTDETVPPFGGVTVAGLNAQVTPAAWPEHDSVTGLEKPDSDFTLQLLVFESPCLTTMLEGVQVMLKSPGGGGGGPLPARIEANITSCWLCPETVTRPSVHVA